ncbi:CLUMA_CG010507, isoform A [Clunio marinus]|uniref:CLUMA_CG010507, isoform A n=1 Tax=Clunio marinus TaxID=568069 RepID=A0A1J1I9X9_9DIPT|nr:CLUMA_CG010507, isoform A [Clunio marinus]
MVEDNIQSKRDDIVFLRAWALDLPFFSSQMFRQKKLLVNILLNSLYIARTNPKTNEITIKIAAG